MITKRKRLYAQARQAGKNQTDSAIFAGCPAKTAAHLARARQWAHLPPREPTSDPLEFLQGIMCDPREPAALRFEAAAALLPYRHARLPPKRPAR